MFLLPFEAVTDTVILSDSFMLRYYQLHPYYWRICDSGVWREFKLSPDYESGNYTFRFKNESIAEFIADGFFRIHIHIQLVPFRAGYVDT